MLESLVSNGGGTIDGASEEWSFLLSMVASSRAGHSEGRDLGQDTSTIAGPKLLELPTECSQWNGEWGYPPAIRKEWDRVNCCKGALAAG